MPSVAPLQGLDDLEIATYNTSSVFQIVEAVAGRLIEGYGARQWVSRSSGLNSATSVNETAILARQQRHVLHVTSTVVSSISLLAAVVAVYWFCKMRKNFRRGLILLLFVGDFCKSFWLLFYSCYAMAHGGVASTSNLCQASGYLLQVSLEMCDCAILLISTHMYLQVFPPPAKWHLGRDGLYRIRYWAYAAWLVIPNITASLAFLNPGLAYLPAGAFCWLPVRPIWYRLALSWIPRYLIWLFFMAVALRIYLYAGKEFKIFRGAASIESTMTLSDPLSAAHLTRVSDNTTVTSTRYSAVTADLGSVLNHSQGIMSPTDAKLVPPGGVYSVLSRRSSTPDWMNNQPSSRWPSNVPFSPSRSLPSSRRGSRQLAAGELSDEIHSKAEINSIHQKGIATTRQSVISGIDSEPPAPAHIATPRRRGADNDDTAVHEVARGMHSHRRQAVQRQLRMLFLYPVVYLAMWIFPFVNHCLNYNNYYAQNPIFAISVLNILCQAAMGFVDVCVFSSREQPWRHIAGSDDTFLGSFCFWRHNTSSRGAHHALRQDSNVSNDSAVMRTKNEAKPASGQPLAGHRPAQSQQSIRPLSTIREKVEGWRRSTRDASNGGSMRKQLEVERAQERLALERMDRQVKNQEIDEHGATTSKLLGPASREWWDTHATDDLLRDAPDTASSA